MVATNPFRRMAETEVSVLGLKELPIVFIAHPVGGLRPELVTAKAENAIDEIVNALTKPRNLGS